MVKIKKIFLLAPSNRAPMLPVGDIHIGCKKAEDNKDVEEFDTFDEPAVADDEHAAAETV